MILMTEYCGKIGDSTVLDENLNKLNVMVEPETVEVTIPVKKSK